MKGYINQFYNEGFATIFYLKPINYFNKKIKNSCLKNVLKKIIKVLYTLLVIIFAGYVFYAKYPFK